MRLPLALIKRPSHPESYLKHSRGLHSTITSHLPIAFPGDYNGTSPSACVLCDVHGEHQHLEKTPLSTPCTWQSHPIRPAQRWRLRQHRERPASRRLRKHSKRTAPRRLRQHSERPTQVPNSFFDDQREQRETSQNNALCTASSRKTLALHYRVRRNWWQGLLSYQGSR